MNYKLFCIIISKNTKMENMNMNGKIIYITNDHLMSENKIFSSLPVPNAETLRVSENSVNGYCKFGVAITPSSCYELSLMEPTKRTELLKQIYGKDGLGLSIGRLCVGSSDYSPEIYSYDDVAFDTELKLFSVERDEKYIIPMLKEILNINPDIYLYASPWSPPYWMKTGESMCGGFMRNEFLDCYANYIVKFIKAYSQYGIKISAITPQNETNTSHYDKMPACIWHPETEAEFIKILKKKFKENHFDIKIWMLDHDFGYIQRVLWSLDNCEGLKENCDGIAFHYYTGAIEQTKVLTEKFPKLELHFTEGGPRLTDHYSTDWCKWGLMVVKALKAGYQSFTGWNLMLDELGGPNIGPFMGICGGFVTYDNRNQELYYSGQYKAFSHIVPYITSNSKVYPITVSDSFNLDISKYPKEKREIEGVVIDNQNGRKIAVIINPNDYNIQTQIELGGKLWYIELYSDSISTVIVEE